MPEASNGPSRVAAAGSGTLVATPQSLARRSRSRYSVPGARPAISSVAGVPATAATSADAPAIVAKSSSSDASSRIVADDAPSPNAVAAHDAESVVNPRTASSAVPSGAPGDGVAKATGPSETSAPRSFVTVARAQSAVPNGSPVAANSTNPAAWTSASSDQTAEEKSSASEISTRTVADRAFSPSEYSRARAVAPV